MKTRAKPTKPTSGQLTQPERGYNTCRKAAAVAVLMAWFEGNPKTFPHA